MIKVNQIEKNYGKFHLNCTMEVPDGCVTGLIGENGAGKSTVFKAIENLIFWTGAALRCLENHIPNLMQRTENR